MFSKKLQLVTTQYILAINYSFGLPLKHNFAEFVYYNGLFLPHETERILNLWDDNQKIKATLSGADTYDDELRKSDVMFIENNPENEWIYNRLAGLAMQCNNERYWFDLLGFHNNLQLANYTEGDFFDWQLSDPDEYEGGDLQFMLNQKIVNAPREKGTIIVFPSFMMHRVTPITKGIRKSIVGWIAGPPYR